MRSLADEVPFDIPNSWEWVRLGSIVYNRGQISPSTDFCYIDIGSIDNKKQKLNPTDTVIAPDKAPSRARKLVDKGDVLYSTVRPYLHNMCIVDRDFSCIPIASTGFAVLTCHAELCNKFLFYYMMSPDFDAYANNTDKAKGVAYYTQYIKRNPEWEFVKVYTDEGISGTNTKHRIGFNEMIADAMSGKIDLIVTKSVSRFARNTVDSLVTIRKLKEKGVEVYFEKENIYTFDGKGELLLTIMSSLAQEESRSISENVTWGQRKRFADGKVNLPYKQFLGYRKGADGFPEVVPEEAIVVHRIYTRFMEGLTPGAIAKELTADGIPTPSRKQRWQTSTVESILQNEKYKGAALLQKCFTVDFLTKKRKVNEGEVPQYYVEHSHEPIITPEEFDKVQTELARRKQISRQYSGKSIFSSRIVCGDCGSYFGSKVWNSTSKYRRVIWQCNGKFKGEHKCETPHLDEETIKARFVTALNAIIESKDNILEDCRLMQATLTDCTGIDTEIESLLEEIDVVTELTKRCIAENSQTAQNQEEYAARYNGFVERYEKAKAQLEQLRATKAAREAQAEAIGAFMFEVQELDALTEFDEKLWLTVIDTVTVHADGRMTFKFRGGKKLTSY